MVPARWLVSVSDCCVSVLAWFLLTLDFLLSLLPLLFPECIVISHSPALVFQGLKTLPPLKAQALSWKAAFPEESERK